MPYEKFEAWKVAHQLALEVYKVTERWPKSERYQLTAQMRRAGLSVPTNIAEGAAKRGVREFRRYLDISLGSLSELSYLLRFSKDLGILDDEGFGDFTPVCFGRSPPDVVQSAPSALSAPSASVLVFPTVRDYLASRTEAHYALVRRDYTGAGFGAGPFSFGCRSWRTLRRDSLARVEAESTQTVVGRAACPPPITSSSRSRK
jgi:four helix bundle protein